MDRRASIVGFSLLLLQSGVYAQTPSADPPDTPPRLKLAPMLLPPPPKALRPGLQPERDAVYLRADLLDQTAPERGPRHRVSACTGRR